jgi:hypothetical protein
MSDARLIDGSRGRNARSDLAWVLVPAVVMSLGWGLRGYIGGGPFGAMIPGALVSLILCQYLGFSVPASAVVVAFGALGIGFGGSMTYGQTLGLLRVDESFSWGLTGTTLKGCVWGLLGGAVLGLGFAARHIAWRHLVLAFVCMLVGVIIGIHFINQPKLIYFSNPVDRPRDESWAGFLFGAITLLTYMGVFQRRYAWIPLRFAAYGAIGGAIGFGGGSLFIALQEQVTETWRWLPYWKVMEFSFGFLFGAALGLCALHLRDRLGPLGRADTNPSPSSSMNAPQQRRLLECIVTALVGIAVVLGVLFGWRLALRQVYPMLRELEEGDLRRTAAGVLMAFTGMGVVLMLLSRRWQAVAWQTAISVTIVAAAIDWQRHLLDRGKIDMPVAYRTAWVVSVAALSIAFVSVWQRRKAPKLINLFLFATCCLTIIGYMKGLGMSDIWWGNAEAEAAAGGRDAYLWKEYRSEVIVHAIFTTLFVLSILAAAKERRRTSH